MTKQFSLLPPMCGTSQPKIFPSFKPTILHNHWWLILPFSSTSGYGHYHIYHLCKCYCTRGSTTSHTISTLCYDIFSKLKSTSSLSSLLLVCIKTPKMPPWSPLDSNICTKHQTGFNFSVFCPAFPEVLFSQQAHNSPRFQPSFKLSFCQAKQSLPTVPFSKTPLQKILGFWLPSGSRSRRLLRADQASFFLQCTYLFTGFPISDFFSISSSFPLQA